MERAGAAVADEVLRAYPEARRIAAVCGGGANGGDGRIAARILREAGRDVVETDDPSNVDLVLDALFGTGFHGAPRPEAAAVIERVNACGAPVVAVDLPSGVDASTGETAGAAVDADLTVTFHGRKVGLVVAPGRFHAGHVVVADIGLEAASTAIRARDSCASRPSSTPRRAGHEVLVGLAPRRRRRARDDQRRRADRHGGDARRRGLRHAGGPCRGAAGRRGAGARAGQARLRVGERRRLAGIRRRALVRARGRSRSRPVGRGARSRTGAARGIVAAGGRRRGRALRPRAGRRATRRRSSLRTRASWRGCSTSSPRGSARTGSRLRLARRSASARSSC